MRVEVFLFCGIIERAVTSKKLLEQQNALARQKVLSLFLFVNYHKWFSVLGPGSLNVVSD